MPTFSHLPHLQTVKSHFFKANIHTNPRTHTTLAFLWLYFLIVICFLCIRRDYEPPAPKESSNDKRVSPSRQAWNANHHSPRHSIVSSVPPTQQRLQSTSARARSGRHTSFKPPITNENLGKDSTSRADNATVISPPQDYETVARNTDLPNAGLYDIILRHFTQQNSANNHRGLDNAAALQQNLQHMYSKFADIDTHSYGTVSRLNVGLVLQTFGLSLDKISRVAGTYVCQKGGSQGDRINYGRFIEALKQRFETLSGVRPSLSHIPHVQWHIKL